MPTIAPSITATPHNTSLVQRWFDEVWNRGNVDVVDEMLAPDGVLHDPSMADVPVLSAEVFKAHARAMRHAIPDIHFAVDFAFEADDHVAARVTVTGTHTGRGLGIDPTGRAFRITGMVVAHVRDGKFVEGWNHFDLLGLFSQLGVIKRPQLGMML